MMCVSELPQADGEAAAAAARGALLPAMEAVPVFEASPAQEWRGHEKVRVPSSPSFLRSLTAFLQPERTACCPKPTDCMAGAVLLSASPPALGTHRHQQQPAARQLSWAEQHHITEEWL